MVIDPGRSCRFIQPTVRRRSSQGREPGAKCRAAHNYHQGGIDKMLKRLKMCPAVHRSRVRTIDLANMNYRLGCIRSATAQMPRTPSQPVLAGTTRTSQKCTTSCMAPERSPSAARSKIRKKMRRTPGQPGWCAAPACPKFQGPYGSKVCPGDMSLLRWSAPQAFRHHFVPRDIIRFAIDPDKVLPLK